MLPFSGDFCGDGLFQELLDRGQAGTATSGHQKSFPEVFNRLGAIIYGLLDLGFRYGITHTYVHYYHSLVRLLIGIVVLMRIIINCFTVNSLHISIYKTIP